MSYLSKVLEAMDNGSRLLLLIEVQWKKKCLWDHIEAKNLGFQVFALFLHRNMQS